MADFSTAHAPVAVWEGGYGNHPADRGGGLCGIARGCHPISRSGSWLTPKGSPTFRQGSAMPFTRHLRQIPGLLEQVTAFYRGLFHSLGLDSEDMPQKRAANEIYEQVVNLGQGGHTRYLQRICNAANYNRKTGTRLFHDLKEDGALGTLTRPPCAYSSAPRRPC